jgi:hypothetical protein
MRLRGMREKGHEGEKKNKIGTKRSLIVVEKKLEKNTTHEMKMMSSGIERDEGHLVQRNKKMRESGELLS